MYKYADGQWDVIPDFITQDHLKSGVKSAYGRFGFTKSQELEYPLGDAHIYEHTGTNPSNFQFCCLLFTGRSRSSGYYLVVVSDLRGLLQLLKEIGAHLADTSNPTSLAINTINSTLSGIQEALEMLQYYAKTGLPVEVKNIADLGQAISPRKPPGPKT